MLTALRTRLTYANVMSTIAVFSVLGGGAYAAVKIPKNSVGAPQLKKNAVTGSKVKNGSLTDADFAGNVLQGAKGDTGPAGTAGVKGDTGPAGLTGPKGDTGAKGDKGDKGTDGAPGAAGTARAYGRVSKAGVADPAISKNVVSVTNPSAGRYCITLDASIDVSATRPVVVDDFSANDSGFFNSNGDDKAVSEIRSSAADCGGGGELEVFTAAMNFNAGALVGINPSNEGFFFMVP